MTCLLISLAVSDPVEHGLYFRSLGLLALLRRFALFANAATVALANAVAKTIANAELIAENSTVIFHRVIF